MSNQILKVAKFETLRQLKKPAFWAAIILMPILIGGIYLISFLSSMHAPETPEIADTKIIVTDEANIIPNDSPFKFNESKESGIEKVKNSEVDLYFYIPENFAETREIDLYHISEGLDIFNSDGNIIKSVLGNYVAEKANPVDVMILTGSYEVKDNKLTATGSDENALGKAIIPFAILVVFFLFICLFGNRFLMVVVEEKENRISEMILTSVSSKHLVIGKIIATMILGAVQIATFVIPAVILIFLNRENPFIASILSMIEITPLTIIANIILFIFSTFLFAGLSTFIGSLVSTARDASQFIAPVIIGVVFPLYFMQAFMATPPSFIVQFLTYFPLSAPTAMMLRNGFGTLSPMEFAIGLAEIVIFSIITIRLTVKTFQKNAINFGIAKPKFLSKK